MRDDSEKSGEQEVFYALKDRLRRTAFGMQIRGILDTPPLVLKDDLNLQVLTQLQHKDLLMYLAALKSFARHVPVSRVHVLNDGSLTPTDQSILRKHVPGVSISHIDLFRDDALPAGGTWERLTAAAHLSQKDYVIQLDADTLTCAPLPEVVNAVEDGASFTIGTWDRQALESAIDRARQADDVLKKGSDHVQILAEAALGRVDGAHQLKYVRGCSGFAGFAPSYEKLKFIRNMSEQMSRLIGPAWANWGSEQFMSNLLIANLPLSRVLPHPDYCDCSKIQGQGVRFVHFIGSCRFNGSRYTDMVKSVLSV